MNNKSFLEKRLQSSRFWYEEVTIARDTQDKSRQDSALFSVSLEESIGTETARRITPSPRYSPLFGQHPSAFRKAALFSSAFALILASLYVYWRVGMFAEDSVAQSSFASWREYLPGLAYRPIAHAGFGSSSKSSFDYALRDNGGSVACDLTTGCFQIPFGIPGILTSPTHAITDSDPPQTWRFRSSTGQLGLTTNVSICPTQTTIEYSFESGLTPDEAPRQVILWGMVEGEENERRFKKLTQNTVSFSGNDPPASPSTGISYSRYRFAHLAAFEFNAISQVSLQTASVHADIRTSGINFNVFVLEIRSNWGGKRTGLSRVRIHGNLCSPSI